MARGGIYKSEVQRAREKLLAQGVNPSIDAVRVELGNTGSKSTIHRHLKEIEEEEGPRKGGKVAVSEAILNLVDTLAGNLQEEAEARVTEAAEKHRAALAKKDEEVVAAQKEAASFRDALERLQLTLAEEKTRHEKTGTSLKTEMLERARLGQQVTDLQERLDAEAVLRQSLEEKHKHAREALEHFRQAVKEQRDQDQRQHEQQVQYLQSELKTLNQNLIQKQQENMLSNQENARLTMELSKAETSLREAKTDLAKTKGLKEALDAATLNEAALGRQVVELQAALDALKTRSQGLAQQVTEQADKLRQQEVELAAAVSQDKLAEQIKGFLTTMAPVATVQPGL